MNPNKFTSRKDRKLPIVPTDFDKDHILQFLTELTLTLSDQFRESSKDSSIAAPSGSIVMHGSSTAPYGYLLCDGTSYLRSDYPELFTAIGVVFGSSDSTHFNVPDFRGIFPKGAGSTTRSAPLGKAADGTTAYSGTLGTYSNDRMQGHKVQSTFSYSSGVGTGGGHVGGSSLSEPNTRTLTDGTPITDGTNGTPFLGKTTEPANLGITFIIKC